jgi:hemoglobin
MVSIKTVTGLQLFEEPMSSIYEQLGGAPAIEAAVEDFYRRVLADDELAPFFEDVDMDRQMAKQAGFLTMVTGGPANYTGKDMRRGHAHLVARGIGDRHVDLVIKHLGDTLAGLGVAPELIAQVAAVAESVRNDVLSR